MVNAVILTLRYAPYKSKTSSKGNFINFRVFFFLNKTHYGRKKKSGTEAENLHCKPSKP